MFRKLLIIIVNLILVGFFNPISNRDEVSFNAAETKIRLCLPQEVNLNNEREYINIKRAITENKKVGHCGIMVGYNANTSFVVEFKNFHLS